MKTSHLLYLYRWGKSSYINRNKNLKLMAQLKIWRKNARIKVEQYFNLEGNCIRGTQKWGCFRNRVKFVTKKLTLLFQTKVKFWATANIGPMLLTRWRLYDYENIQKIKTRMLNDKMKAGVCITEHWTLDSYSSFSLS